MKKQLQSNRQTIVFIAALVLLLAANFSAFAQWSNMDEWRTQYKVGDKVQISISGNQSDYQTCTVTENDPNAVMRVRCEAFKFWSAGDYIASKNFVRPIPKAKTSGNNKQTKNEEETPAEIQNDQAEWSVNDKWRSGFKVGDKIKMSISGKAEDLQTCIVSENDPEAVMRAKCNDFKDWRAGVNIVSEFQVNIDSKSATNPPNNKTIKGNSTRLKIGEYACTGAGGRMMIGLGFKVTSANRYTDLDGKRSGTFTISGGKITFRGGHLAGVIGRELKDNWFTVASQASCGPYN